MNILRMNYRQYRKARRLTHECCNYCDGNCLLLDAVLYTEIMERSGARRCRECGELFSPRRPNCLYCPPCVEKRKRQSKKLWARKHRGYA